MSPCTPPLDSCGHWPYNGARSYLAFHACCTAAINLKSKSVPLWLSIYSVCVALQWGFSWMWPNGVAWHRSECIANQNIAKSFHCVTLMMFTVLAVCTSVISMRGLGGVVGLMLPLALAAAVRVPYTTSPCSDLGQVVNLSLSVA